MLALLCQFSGGGEGRACESRVQRTPIFAKTLETLQHTDTCRPKRHCSLLTTIAFACGGHACFSCSITVIFCVSVNSYASRAFLGSDKNTINLNDERAREKYNLRLHTDLAITPLFHINCADS